MITQSVTINVKEIQQLAKQFPDAVQNRMQRIYNDGSIIVASQITKNAAVGVTGNLNRNVQRTVTKNGARIVPKEKYHSVIENGRRAGGKMPPYKDPLFVKWVETKLGSDASPFLVARSIAKKGTKAQPFIVPAYNTTKPIVHKYADNEIKNMVAELNK